MARHGEGAGEDLDLRAERGDLVGSHFLGERLEEVGQFLARLALDLKEKT